MNTWQFTPYAYLYILAAGGSYFISYIAWQMRPTRGATQFCYLTLATGTWTLGYLLGLLNTDLAWKLIFLRVEYLGITFTNVFWILFTLAYSHYDEWLTRKVYALIGFLPALTFLQILTVEHHNFIYHLYDLTAYNGLVITKKIYGPGFYLWASYSYLVLLLCGMIVVASLLRLPDPARAQAFLPALIMAGVFITSILFITGNNPIAPFDPTPLTFVLAGAFILIILRRYGFLNIVPVAHNLIFKNINSGIIIIDERTHILDLNPKAEQIVDQPQTVALGKPILDTFPASQALMGAFDETRETTTEMITRGNTYELHVTPMKTPSGKLAGYILLFYDITHRKELEAKQQQLIDELQDALDQVKTLGGLLPICASCKKIRDDGGYWHQVEAYIRNHSDAQFTHGICPECLERVYGQHLDKQ